MTFLFSRPWRPLPLLSAALLLAALVYWPGLYGGWLFDDYPNIVDNRGVQPQSQGLAALLNAALSSPASEFKRPLASLTFALNYVLAGLDPFWMKLTNLAIHLLNGVLVFLLGRRLLTALAPGASLGAAQAPRLVNDEIQAMPSALTSDASNDTRLPRECHRAGMLAALIALGWLLLPINLTAVLYVVQRMESLANLFVLAGLIGYVAGRQRMLASAGRRGFWLSVASITVPTGLGLLAKETAVLLPLYALAIEWVVFCGVRDGTAALTMVLSDGPFEPAQPAGPTSASAPRSANGTASRPTSGPRRDWRVIALFALVLALPILLGLGWLLPQVLNPVGWSGRDFTLTTRLLSELRIVVDYIGWTLLPWPDALSFYHDDYVVSTGWLTPWTTLASAVVIAALLALMVHQRRRRPTLALGLALFFAGQSLTATILPLELIYEHRNYFASFGLLLALIPWLLTATGTGRARTIRHAVLAALLLLWGTQTLSSAYAWGDPLSLARLLAARAPDSPRAQYELGRTYIIYSRYDPLSPYTRLAYAPLERAAGLRDSSILPQQALIFMNSRMGLPLKDAWWDSMIAKLKAKPLGVQDDSSLAALTDCARDGRCNLPRGRMIAAFEAALTHPRPSARVLATYSDYAWSVLGDRPLGQRMIERAVAAAPNEPAYRITLGRMLLSSGRPDEAARQVDKLRAINVGGRLDKDIHALQQRIDSAHASSS
jgi:hypothetical protein